MKKPFLIAFIVCDALAMAFAGYVLYRRPSHSKEKAPVSSQTPVLPTPSVASAPATSTGIVALSPQTPVGIGMTAGVRNILFKFSNSKAKQVSLRADFTGWKAEPMRRDERGVWTYQAKLTPGEYAYIFVMDDKPIRDPANKKIKRIGTTQVSAILVKPISPSVH